MGKSTWNMISGILLVIGGLNWGLVGLGYFFSANLNVVNLLFTVLIGVPALEAIVYLLVGVSAVVHAFTCSKT